MAIKEFLILNPDDLAIRQKRREIANELLKMKKVKIELEELQSRTKGGYAEGLRMEVHFKNFTNDQKNNKQLNQTSMKKVLILLSVLACLCACNDEVENITAPVTSGMEQSRNCFKTNYVATFEYYANENALTGGTPTATFECGLEKKEPNVEKSLAGGQYEWYDCDIYTWKEYGSWSGKIEGLHMDGVILSGKNFWGYSHIYFCKKSFKFIKSKENK